MEKWQCSTTGSIQSLHAHPSVFPEPQQPETEHTVKFLYEGNCASIRGLTKTLTQIKKEKKERKEGRRKEGREGKKGGRGKGGRKEERKKEI